LHAIASTVAQPFRSDRQPRHGGRSRFDGYSAAAWLALAAMVRIHYCGSQ